MKHYSAALTAPLGSSILTWLKGYCKRTGMKLQTKTRVLWHRNVISFQVLGTERKIELLKSAINRNVSKYN